jgi:hypothetical protein
MDAIKQYMSFRKVSGHTCACATSQSVKKHTSLNSNYCTHYNYCYFLRFPFANNFIILVNSFLLNFPFNIFCSCRPGSYSQSHCSERPLSVFYSTNTWTVYD